MPSTEITDTNHTFYGKTVELLQIPMKRRRVYIVSMKGLYKIHHGCATFVHGLCLELELSPNRVNSAIPDIAHFKEVFRDYNNNGLFSV